MNPPQLTAAEEATYAALQKLVKGYKPRISGGFDADDISSQCQIKERMLIQPPPSEEIQMHLYALESYCLVTSIEAPMTDDAWPTHYTIQS